MCLASGITVLIVSTKYQVFGCKSTPMLLFQRPACRLYTVSSRVTTVCTSLLTGTYCCMLGGTWLGYWFRPALGKCVYTYCGRCTTGWNLSCVVRDLPQGPYMRAKERDGTASHRLISSCCNLQALRTPLTKRGLPWTRHPLVVVPQSAECSAASK